MIFLKISSIKWLLDSFYSDFFFQMFWKISSSVSIQKLDIPNIFYKIDFLIFQSYQPTDFSELMNLVSAQQTTLQSQHAEIKQVCNKNYLCFY